MARLEVIEWPERGAEVWVVSNRGTLDSPLYTPLACFGRPATSAQRREANARAQSWAQGYARGLKEGREKPHRHTT